MLPIHKLDGGQTRGKSINSPLLYSYDADAQFFHTEGDGGNIAVSIIQSRDVA
jgi:hypothetical protein